MHVSALAAACTVLAFPAAHCEQVIAAPVLNDPAVQSLQPAVPVLLSNLPGTHTSHPSEGGKKVHETPTS